MAPIDAMERSRCELRGCVTLATEDVEGHVWLIADYPAVVSGRNVEEVAGPHHDFASVVHLGHRLTAQYEADMLHLARRLTSHRPDVLRPLPTRLVELAWVSRRPCNEDFILGKGTRELCHDRRSTRMS